jgi:HD-GYP domain-containing protein (c-di-GMP phosphodiesterase class II)
MPTQIAPTRGSRIPAAASRDAQDLGFMTGGRSAVSSRAGFMPISIAHAPAEAFAGIAVYIRPGADDPKKSDSSEATFLLHCTEKAPFTLEHRKRLQNQGIKFVYIPIGDHQRFRRQIEELLPNVIHDPATSASVKAEIVYETSVELVNELLTDPNMLVKSQRLAGVSRAVATLVLDDPMAFAHLFAASHHDFYTATHLVNVATWMVPLAFAVGIRTRQELETICQAGLLHDIGKLKIPPAILNKKTALRDDEWRTLRTHPSLGSDYLALSNVNDPVIQAVTSQHHERQDGSGYPKGIGKDKIHLAAKICAVVDSFDALTALRPYKLKAMSVAQATGELLRESPLKYDRTVVDAWSELLGTTNGASGSEHGQETTNTNQRQYPRYGIKCSAGIVLLGRESPPMIGTVVTNLSRRGMGVLSPMPIELGCPVRIQMHQQRGRRIRQTFDAVVVRCKSSGEGWFDLGLMFGER